jgi:hypothetical protein
VPGSKVPEERLITRAGSGMSGRSARKLGLAKIIDGTVQVQRSARRLMRNPAFHMTFPNSRYDVVIFLPSHSVGWETASYIGFLRSQVMKPNRSEGPLSGPIRPV